MTKSVLGNIFSLDAISRVVSGIKYRINRLFHEKLIFRIASKESIFTSIWRNNYWGSAESASGPGSTLEYTREIREKIPPMFEQYGIKAVFDAPFGDMRWMQHVIKGENFSYLGGDIVGELIETNRAAFADDNVKFIKFDITSDAFPMADVWLCRAVFYHLSHQDIYLALEQFARSDIEYILTTNHITNDTHVNKDITTGDWRCSTSLYRRLISQRMPYERLTTMLHHIPLQR